MAGLLALLGTSSAQGDATVSGPLSGSLLSVGPNQRSLIVGWEDSQGPGCGIETDSVSASATETAASVSVTVAAQWIVDPPGVACPLSLDVGTVTVALASPLDGRRVDGLTIQGQGFAVQWRRQPPPMPNLVGLSPLDARLMMTNPVGVVHGETFSGVGPVGLVDHHTHHSRTGGAFAMVVAQRPLAGKPIRSHMTVVLTVAP